MLPFPLRRFSVNNGPSHTSPEQVDGYQLQSIASARLNIVFSWVLYRVGKWKNSTKYLQYESMTPRMPVFNITRGSATGTVPWLSCFCSISSGHHGVTQTSCSYQSGLQSWFNWRVKSTLIHVSSQGPRPIVNNQGLNQHWHIKPFNHCSSPNVESLAL